MSVVVVIVMALVVVGCGDDGGPEPTAQPGVGDAQESGSTGRTYTVGVDGTADDFTGSFHRFFPERLSVHAGDTIVFRRPDNGEPHTVTSANEPPTRSAVPGGHFFRGGFGGPPRKDMSMPCVLAEGDPPPDGCSAAEREPVAFDGTQSWFNSGGLLGDEEFAVELTDDVAPGEYVFVCLIHSPLMQATVEVVAPQEPAEDPADVAARGKEELERERAKARRLVDDPRSVADGQVLAATADPTFTAWSNAFAPDEVEIAAGGTVTWAVRGLHTISFNAPESARPLYERADDGSVQQNELAAQPQGDAGAWDGSGMLSSGLQEGLFPPGRFRVTFTVPGTYAYHCLVHFDMEGKVKVLG